jgi:predicted Zn-dependent protease
MTRRIWIAILTLAAPAFAAEDVVMKAMRDELARSMKKLQLENLQKPYFVSFREIETESCGVSASFGAIVNMTCEPRVPNRPRSRQLSVEVRVGDYARDNTNFYAFRLQASGVVRIFAGDGMTVPLDDNYDEIRRQLWLATDSAYKQALDVYAKKKAALENRTRTDDAPDFSKEPVVTDAETAPPIEWNPAELQAGVKALSAIFRDAKGIADSEVRFNATNALTRYVNSEGSSYTRQNSIASYQVNANTQAADGMPLGDVDVIYARSMAGLPSRDELARRVRALQSRLEKLRTGALVERYAGPVLFEGQAAAEILIQGLANAVVGVPRLVVDDSRFERVFSSDDGTFADKIGGKVLPEFLSLKDDATAREFQGQPLLGAYQVDEEGVKARSTALVDKGIFQTLLRSRALIPNTSQSTANRRAMGAMATNLIFSSEKSLPADQLKAELIRIAKARGKEYGILIRRLNNPVLAQSLNRGRTIVITSRGAGMVDVEPAIEAYKVFQDGHEELVRNLNINGMTLASFKDIVAVSDALTVYSAPFRNKRVSPASMGTFIVAGTQPLLSVVAPGVLFDDLTVQRPTGDIPNLPFSPHPFFDTVR